MTTIPEAPETIEAQLQWLREGKRKAVLLTPGTAIPDLPAFVYSAATVPQGIIIYRHDLVSRHEIAEHAYMGTLGTLLGYGIPSKPETRNSKLETVVIRSANGHEKQSVVADSERLDAATAAAQQVADPGDTVSIEDGQRVLTDRLRSLDQRELRVRPYDPQRDVLALAQAAKEDAHHPLNPTHVIERGEEIVGYFGVNSLPLYRLWFHSEKMKAADSLRLLFMIENHYRMAGVPLIATIISTGSPFYPVAARGGYLEAPGDRLFLKEL
jgi:hypothetical protein